MKKLFSFLIVSGIALFLPVSIYALPYTSPDISFAGIEYSAIQDSSPYSQWWQAGGAITTAWDSLDPIAASNGLWVEYETSLTAGNWNIGLDVINHSNVSLGTGWYDNFSFQLELINQSTQNTIIKSVDVAASDTEVNNGYFNSDVSDGLYTLRVSWLNDAWAPRLNLDANIQIEGTFFDRLDDDQTGAAAPVPEPTTIFLLGSGLVGLAGFRKKTGIST